MRVRLDSLDSTLSRKWRQGGKEGGWQVAREVAVRAITERGIIRRFMHTPRRGEKVTRTPRLVSPTCSCIDPRNCKYLPPPSRPPTPPPPWRRTYASFPSTSRRYSSYPLSFLFPPFVILFPADRPNEDTSIPPKYRDSRVRGNSSGRLCSRGGSSEPAFAENV